MSGGEILVHVAEYKVGGAGDILLFRATFGAHTP